MVIWRRFLISLVLALSLLLAATPAVLADTSTSVSIGSAADVPVGGSVDVEVRINTDEAGIGQATITLTVDTAVVTVDNITGVLSYNTVGDTTTMVTVWGSNKPTGDFLFATVTLTAVGDYEDCSNLDIAVTEMYNNVYQSISPSPVTDGEFCIQAAPPTPTPVTPTPVTPTPVTPTPVTPTPVTPTPVTPTPVTPTSYSGHSYSGHSYSGHSYSGHSYSGHSYSGHSYSGHSYSFANTRAG